MKNAVIVDSVRTGLAKSFRGGFNMTRPDEMLAHIINALLERNPNLPPEAVEDIIMGCGNPEGAQGHNVGRNAAVLSNLPITVGGTTINRYCSSGMQSISMASSPDYGRLLRYSYRRWSRDYFNASRETKYG